MAAGLRCSAAVTDQLDLVYADEDASRVDPVLDGLQRASLVRDEW